MKRILCMAQTEGGKNASSRKLFLYPFMTMLNLTNALLKLKRDIPLRTLACCLIGTHVTSGCGVTVNHIKCDPGLLGNTVVRHWPYSSC